MKRLAILAMVLLLMYVGSLYRQLTSPSISAAAAFLPAATTDAVNHTESQSLPASASDICFVSASVGMQGRLRAYRFTAPVSDLHSHAMTELAAFGSNWSQPNATPFIRSNVKSPFDAEYLAFLKKSFDADASWLAAPLNTKGTIYNFDANLNDVPRRPTIFVDETNGVLYFVVTD
ncbi:MAG: hypothetical protein KDA87_08205 [Planctomycetales bacterium]|nr:hypothetical protein [Planctomycetales bacterium]